MLNTPFALVLLARKDHLGLYRIPGGTNDFPGIFVKPDPNLSLAKQLPRFLAAELQEPELEFHTALEIILNPEIEIPGHGKATVLLCSCTLAWPSDIDVPPTFPERLRKMPKNRNRLAFNKAFQYMMGAETEKMDLIEFNPKDLNLN